MLRKMPYILIFIILAVLLCGPLMPLVLKQGLYAISLGIKSLMSLALPFVVFGLLFVAFAHLAKGATKLIALVLVLVCCSNFVSTFIAHYFGILVFNSDITTLLPSAIDQDFIKKPTLEPLFFIALPVLIPTGKAMLLGMILGVVAPKFFREASTKVAAFLNHWVNVFIRGFVCIIPLFIAGFMVKLQYDDVISLVIKDYSVILALIVSSQMVYLLMLYVVLEKGSVRAGIININNMLPAAISGFISMSSAASMPLTIMGAEKNIDDRELARSVIPATVNIHLVGNCFTATILIYAVLKSFGAPEPSFASFMTFTFYFIISKFSVVAIPAGGVAVLLPILEAHLGFNADMISLITALYILFDPIVTCGNILGNGAFVRLVDRCLFVPVSSRSTL